MQDRNGRLFVVTAPSGAGKTTLTRALLAGDPGLVFSVSFTTRKPRAGEVDGRDYRFVDHAGFERMIAAGELLEYARVFDNYYGTSRAAIEAHTRAGRNVLLDIDWQGARQVRQRMPESVLIFILPPSLAELERRLRGRATDSDEVIARRLSEARSDMGHWGEFDYAVVNEDVGEAVGALRAIVAGQAGANQTTDPALRRRVAGILEGGPAPG